MSSIETIAKFEPFTGLSEDLLEYFVQALEKRTYKSGETITREGTEDPYVYLLTTGSIEAFKKNDQGEEIALRVIEPGETMGLTSMFEKRKRSATLVCKKDATLLALPHDTVFTLLEDRKNPHSLAFITSLLGNFARHIQRKNRDVARLRSVQRDPRVTVTFFDTKPYTEDTFIRLNKEKFNLRFLEARLSPETVRLAENSPVVCAFVNDDLSGDVVRALREVGVEHLAMRCAGYNNVDLEACKEVGLTVTRVPAYSPYAVAEHAVALLLCLNRKLHRAYLRVREGNFRLDGLVGFDLHGKNCGVVGTGKIGKIMASIMRGFGCEVLCYDPYPDESYAAAHSLTYCGLEELLRNSDIISLHAPLTPDTYHMIDDEAVENMRNGVVIVNTSRGGLIDTMALIDGLKSGKIGGAALDVYEEEADFFFEDYSGKVINDDVLARLLTFNNVLVTSHQAFLTNEALENISETVLANIEDFAGGKKGEELENVVE